MNSRTVSMSPARHPHGWTFVELLVSIAVLGLLLTVIVLAIGASQRSWMTASTSVELARTTNEAQTTLRFIRKAALQPHDQYDATRDQLTRASDLHFVCGSAQELIPKVQGTCGDAIFFQQASIDGALQQALQATGFFIQYSDDDAWRPVMIGNLRHRSRFRLLRFQQLASELTLPPNTTPALRGDVYAWFARPLGDATHTHASVVAENVVAMFIDAQPGLDHCYDTRRAQWEGDTPSAQQSRHRLPRSLEITLLIVDERSWARLDDAQSNSFATSIIAQSRSNQMDKGYLLKLRQWLGDKGVNAHIATTVVPVSM